MARAKVSKQEESIDLVAVTGTKAIVSMDDLVIDAKNANQSTPRGMSLLRESIEACGLGRSIVVDKHGVVIGGNRTLETARKLGKPITVVQTDGHELIAVQRTDLDLKTDRKARRLAYYDNRVGELDLSWSPGQIQEDLAAGVDLTVGFFQNEIDKFAPKDSGMEVRHAVEESAIGGEDLSAGPQFAEPAMTPLPIGPTFQIAFDGEAQHLRWLGLMRLLRERYPDMLTPGARFCAYLSEVEP